MQRQSTLSTLSLLLLIAACGKAPVPIAGQAPPPPQPSQAAMPADDIHAGLATQGSMPPMPGGAVEGEPHLATSGPSDTYAGVIRLRGSLSRHQPQGRYCRNGFEHHFPLNTFRVCAGPSRT